MSGPRPQSLPGHWQGTVDCTRKRIGALLVGALLLRLFRIGSQSLWVDEMLTISVSLPKGDLTIWDYLKHNIHGPVHSLAVYLFHFVGTSEFWLRLPSALAGVGAVYFLYRWVRYLWGERTAWAAAVILAVNPLHLYYSQEVRNYSFLLFFSLLACYRFHRYQREGRGAAPYVLAMALAALSNFSAAFLYACHTLIYLAAGRDRGRRLKHWGLISLAILILIGPWVYRILTVIHFGELLTPVLPGELSESERLRGATTFTLWGIPYALYVFSVGFSFGPSLRFLHTHPSAGTAVASFLPELLAVVVVFGSLGVLGLSAMAARKEAWREDLIYMGLPMVLLLALSWQNAKAFNVRYVLVSLPPYLALIARGVVALSKKKAVVAAAMLALIVLWSDSNYWFNGEYAREDVRAAARYVEREASEGDCILAPTVREVFAYYYRGAGSIRPLWSPPGTPRAVVAARLQKATRGCNSLWYVRARPWEHDAQGYTASGLTLGFEEEGSRSFDGVEVIKLRRKP